MAQSITDAARTIDQSRTLDEIEYGLRERPCSGSQMAVKLHLDDGSTLRGINVYSTISDDVSDEVYALARWSPRTRPSRSGMPASTTPSTRPCRPADIKLRAVAQELLDQRNAP